MADTVRHKEFGKDLGLIHEVVVTGRKVGATKEFWSSLAHNEGLLRRIVLQVLSGQLAELADKNGRIIPRGMRAAVCDPNKDFHLVQPSLDYADRFVRFQEAFKIGPVMAVAEFEKQSKKLIAEIRENKVLCNLLNGVFMPIIMPPLASDVADHGKILEEVFVPAAKSAYETQYPGRKFHNYREGDLAGKVSIVPESRHDRLIAKMREGPVVVLYLPVAFQGFSVLASREQMATLPGSLVLSGGVDVFSAMAMYPDVLARDFHTPGYDLSALTWRSPDGSLCLKAGDGRLSFDGWGGLGGAGAYDSSGLLFLGSA